MASFHVNAPAAAPPAIASMNPNPVPGLNANQTVTINGSGFQSGTGLKVHVATGSFATDLTGTQVTWLSANQLSIQINVGTAAANWTAQVVNPDGQSSSVFPFSVTAPATAPTITGVSPNPVTGSNSSQTITINGTAFVNKPTVFVTWTGGSKTLTSAEVAFISSTQLQLTINVSTTADNWTVKATNPDGQGSNVASFHVNAPAAAPPAIASMNPNPVPGLNANQTVTINGSGFQSGTGLKVHVATGSFATDLTGTQVTWLSANQVSIQINVGTAAANWTAQVVNPDGQSSSVFPFSVTAPATAPTITGVSPNPVTGSNSSQTITLNGTAFVNKPTVFVTWTGGSKTLTSAEVAFISSTQLQLTINVSTTADNWTVKATNPDGQSSNVASFHVNAPAAAPPAIASMNPNPVPGLNANQTVTINGSGFQSGTGLKVHVASGSFATDLTGTQVTWLSANQLSIQINVGTAAANWTAQVVNPDGQSSSVFPFSVTAPVTAPTITGVSPNPVTGSNNPQTITINGTAFVNKPTVFVTWTGGSKTLTSAEVAFIGSTQLQLTINVSTTADNWTVKATNPDGQSSNVASFHVNAPAPTIAGISPNPVTGSNISQTIAINGTAFVNKPTVFVTWTGGWKT